MDGQFKGNGKRQEFMKHDVSTYDVKEDRKKRRTFKSKAAADAYADALKEVKLKVENPEPIIIEVEPAQ